MEFKKSVTQLWDRLVKSAYLEVAWMDWSEHRSQQLKQG